MRPRIFVTQPVAETALPIALAGWRDEGGSQRKENFAKKSAAESFNAEIRNRLDRGTSLDLAAGKQLVSTYSAAWRANLALRPSSAERLERVFRLHLDQLPAGRMAIAAVRMEPPKSNAKIWLLR